MTYARSLARFSTRQLLAMRDRLYKLYGGYPRWSDRWESEDMRDTDWNGPSLADIKTELAGREHVPNKLEARKIRQEKAKRR